MTQKFAPPFSGLTIDLETFRTLIANTSLLAQLSEYLPIGIWVLNSEGRIIYVNTEAQEIWGGTRLIHADEFHQFKGWWLDSGKRLECSEWAAARAFQHGETSANDEITIETFDGARKIIRSRAIPIRTSEGKVVGVVALHEDITARKLAERRLQTVEDQYHRIVEHALQGIVLFDAAWNVTFVNGVGAAMLGHTPQELIGRPVVEVFPAQDAGRVEEEMSNHFRGVSTTWEAQAKRKDGMLLWLRMFGSPINDELGQVCGAQAVFIDVTEEKKAEVVLDEENRKVKQALYAAHMLAWDWDLASDSVVTSGRLADVLEFVVPDPGKSLSRLSQLVHPDDLPRLRADVTRAAEQDHCLVSEFRIVNPDDGTVQWLEAQGVATVDARGNASSLRGVLSNITLRKHSEETLKESEEQARVLAEELQVMVDASREKMILLDDQGIIRALSAASAREFGQEHEELIGRNAREFVRPEECFRLRLMAEDLLRHPGSQTQHLLEIQSAQSRAWWTVLKASVLAVGSRKMFVLSLERMPRVGESVPSVVDNALRGMD